MRKILNFPVQSAASDWALCALYEIYKTFSQDEVKICATVHDSIIMEIRKNENFKKNILKIQSIMQGPQLAKKYITKAVDLPIVADIEIGPWGIGVGLDEYEEASNE
jgi:DNA polymerase I-like protein with 3'-5' exonuclease and polymerase domains